MKRISRAHAVLKKVLNELGGRFSSRAIEEVAKKLYDRGYEIVPIRSGGLIYVAETSFKVPYHYSGGGVEYWGVENYWLFSDHGYTDYKLAHADKKRLKAQVKMMHPEANQIDLDVRMVEVVTTIHRKPRTKKSVLHRLLDPIL